MKQASLYIFHGQPGPWPAVIDLATPPPLSQLRLNQIHGANGTSGGDHGDTLDYSAAAGDVNGDGLDDLITNEMLGNGAAIDEGNLIVLSGALISAPIPVPALSIGWLVALAALLALLGVIYRNSFTCR